MDRICEVTLLSQSPETLLESQWTAVDGAACERHYTVVQLGWMDPGRNRMLETVTLEAEGTQRRRIMPWRALNDGRHWLPGWR